MRRTRGRSTALAVLVLLATALFLAPAARAEPRPAWSITSHASPSHFSSGATAVKNAYVLVATNTGGAATDGTPITITDHLSIGLTADPGGLPDIEFAVYDDGVNLEQCDPGPPVSCVYHGAIPPGGRLYVFVPTNVAANAPDPVTNFATVSGGGAVAATVAESTPVTSDLAPFGVQRFETTVNDDDGEPSTRAGSHPSRVSLGFQLLTNPINEGAVIGPAESLRDIVIKFPPGLIVDPAAIAAHCTEAQFVTNDCPDAAAVGVVHPTVGAFSSVADPLGTSPLFAMVPPPGAPAAFAFNAAGIGLFAHLIGGFDSTGGYGAISEARYISDFGAISGVAVELWGDPSDPSHDKRRGECGYGESGNTCPVPPTDTPLLTMPSACSGPLSSEVTITSWQNNQISATTETVDGERNPVGVTGCSALEFEPSLEVRPTTNVADSPSGLDVNVHVPQTSDHSTLATSTVKSTTITLPKGLAVNPSAANGLKGCSPAEIGMTTAVGQTPIHFTGEKPTCPAASRIGSVEVSTPLLDDPLLGSAYIAAPYQNPFGSLLAIYIAVDDPQTGVVIVLAGEVTPDPQTGQLTTTFKDLPQLPFEDVKVNLFGGAGGTLRTPATCGTYSTTSEFGPYSGNPAATPKDTYSISAAPTGSCTSSEAGQPHAPSFDAGTVTPVAGAFSPFVMNLRRNDGSQQFKSLTVSPPPGLTAKLAGTPECPQAALDAAAAKSGKAELASPSCPAASQVGTVNVAAGAGPAPYNATGRVYLAGPYNGAPLSLAIVTPATAGPFDLGTVVVRTALRINPVTAQITAEADPIPAILQGIPLDVRSVQLRLDRPGFVVNPTSCEPMSIAATATSALGTPVPLSNGFQVGDCAALGFRPRLALHLSGGLGRNAHPAVTVDLTPRPGDANVAGAAFALPTGELLDVHRVRALCARQLTPELCPRDSRLGQARLWSHLLEDSLEGPIYLRVPSARFPDLVADLRAGRLHFLLHGRTAAAPGGALWVRFTGLPDLPLSRASFTLAGGRQGIFVNSEALCARPRRATVSLSAHNGKRRLLRPKVRARC
jgi:hypothetical protein